MYVIMVTTIDMYSSTFSFIAINFELVCTTNYFNFLQNSKENPTPII